MELDNLYKFLDENGRIKNWPKQKDYMLQVLEYLSGKFELDRKYTEKEVNAIIQQWHTFEDYFLLRRELIESKLMLRTKSGSEYWREKQVK
jgi:hypothetical protein